MATDPVAAAQRGIELADGYAAAIGQLVASVAAGVATGPAARSAPPSAAPARSAKGGGAKAPLSTLKGSAKARLSTLKGGAKAPPGVRAPGRLAADVLRGPFLAPGSLTRAERLRIVEGAERVLEGVYTHLPLKRARYAFDPVQRLRILRGQVDALSDAAFHIELADILTRLRDAHTRYVGPATLEGVAAMLPFQVERIGSLEQPRYIVTQVAPGLDPAFARGVVVEYWSGVPIDLAVQRWSEHEIGGRPDSQRAAAVQSLTTRSLQYGAPPDEHWVIVGWRTVDAQGEPAGALNELRVPWRIVNPNRVAPSGAGAGAGAKAGRAAAQALRQAVNPAAAAVRRAKMLLFAPQALAGPAPRPARARGKPARAARVESLLPETLRVSVLATPQGPVAWLRIWAFDSEPEVFIDELLRLLPLLPGDGLIIDVRANPGGYIEAAERALQLFTPRPITPTRFSVLATPFTRALAQGAGMARAELAPWRQSLEAAVRNGELYARPLPISDPEACNAIGQVYGGPVVLVADASTYSSGDLFCAGFVDNGIGPFVCVGEATGAGGANVWDYADLRRALAASAQPLPALPDGVGLSLAFRRATRGGPSEGLPIEDVGVAGAHYAMTHADLLDGNRDLLAHCVTLLRRQPLTRLGWELQDAPRGVKLLALGLDRIDVVIDGAPAPSLRPVDDVPAPVAFAAGARRMELVGLRRGQVMQRRRIDLRG